MKKFLHHFQRIIIYILLFLMAVVILLATIQLGVIIYREIFKPDRLGLLHIKELMTILGFFLTVLIGFELLEVIRAYLADDVVHVEIVFLAAIIAIIKKVIVLDAKNLDAPTLFGISAIIITLSCGYYVVKKALKSD